MVRKSVLSLALLAAVFATQIRAEDPVALEGYCAVCIVKGSKWVKGKAEFSSKFDGRVYHFPSEKEKMVFEASPEKFVPALNGDCTVCFAKMKKRMPGKVSFATRYKDRVYLFPSDEQRSMFQKDPASFANVDLAANGNCIICKKMAGKDVPGKAEFTAIHNGMRYQFPSAKEKQMFAKEPTKFVAEKMMDKKMMDKKMGAKMKTTATQMVSTATFSGKSGCAACEHGVRPINDPGKLGLAINGADGSIYVIESAHAKWPQIYAKRFDSLNLVATGKVIKQSGKVTWIEPTSLEAR